MQALKISYHIIYIRSIIFMVNICINIRDSNQTIMKRRSSGCTLEPHTLEPPLQCVKTWHFTSQCMLLSVMASTINCYTQCPAGATSKREERVHSYWDSNRQYPFMFLALHFGLWSGCLLYTSPSPRDS